MLDLKIRTSNSSLTKPLYFRFLLAKLLFRYVWFAGFLGNIMELESKFHGFLCLVDFKGGNWNLKEGLFSFK